VMLLTIWLMFLSAVLAFSVTYRVCKRETKEETATKAPKNARIAVWLDGEKVVDVKEFGMDGLIEKRPGTVLLVIVYDDKGRIAVADVYTEQQETFCYANLEGVIFQIDRDTITTVSEGSHEVARLYRPELSPSDY
jgi:hypothetical protein